MSFRSILLATLLTTATAAFAQGSGPEASTTIHFDGFLDPTENAFSLDVPTGWTTRGGIRRVSQVQPVRWVTTGSPDGMSQVFLGDPGIPPFFVEPYGTVREGQTVQANGRIEPFLAMHYLPAQAFAQTYGVRVLAGICARITVQDARPQPDFARAIAAQSQGNFPIEGGIAQFACERAGQKLRGGVLVAEAITFQPPPSAPPAAGGLANRVPPSLWAQGPPLGWAVFNVSGFLAPEGQQDVAYAVLMHMTDSVHLDQQWIAAQTRMEQQEIARQNDEGAAAREQIQRQSEQFTALILAQGEAAHASLMNQHYAFMARQQREADDRTNRFVANWLRKDINTNVFIHSYIQGQTLVCPRGGACAWVGGN
jgi:hypothetical protein